MKKLACPLPHVDWLEQLATIKALRQEMVEACSPKPFSVGIPSKAKTATEVEMLLRQEQEAKK